MLGTFHDRSPEFRVAGVSMCVLFTFGHVERQGFKSRIRGRECSSEMKLPGWRSGKETPLEPLRIRISLPLHTLHPYGHNMCLPWLELLNIARMQRLGMKPGKR